MLTAQLTPKLTESWNLSLLALCGWREARNQGRLGMTAVCWSVRNRVSHPAIHWWGQSWPGVILHPYQYSSFNHDDPNALLLPSDPASDSSWADALQAAENVYTPPPRVRLWAPPTTTSMVPRSRPGQTMLEPCLRFKSANTGSTRPGKGAHRLSGVPSTADHQTSQLL
jgi:hypothetical protein